MRHDALLADLDAEQQHAVTTPSRVVAVIAGAGSGKTRVLTRRIAHRVLDGTADPRHTLVLTFTRDAAGELRRRLPGLGLRERIEAGTFHAVMLGLLRQHAVDRDHPIPTIVADRRRLLAEAMGPSGTRSLDALTAEIDWAAARGLDPAGYEHQARRQGRRSSLGFGRVAEAYAEYQRLKRRRGVWDLDDLLAQAVQLLEQDSAFAEVTAWRFRHLLVDEAQDLNPLQHRLVELLRRGSEDLFLVGDPAQAIFGFNGADPALLVEVEVRFPGIEVVRLGTNHRCSPQVLDAGIHVLRRAGDEPTAVRSDQPDGPPPRLVAAEDEHDEARRVATLIRALDPELLRRREVAVLARTRAQLDVLASALEIVGVPVRQRAGDPGTAHRMLVDTATRLGSSARLRAWAHDLTELTGNDVDDDRSAARAEIATAVLDFLREQPRGDGAALRSWFATTDPLGWNDATGVELRTFHAAKGREWSTVIVTGVESGLVPHRSATTNAARAEEARLLYVALTRARHQLVITWAQRRGGYQRRISPLLEAFVPPEHAPVSPPEEMLTATHGRLDPLVHRSGQRRRALQSWRETSARGAGMLPEQFCSDDILRRIAEDPPMSAAELDERTGIGRITATRWFADLDAALHEPTDRAGQVDPDECDTIGS